MLILAFALIVFSLNLLVSYHGENKKCSYKPLLHYFNFYNCPCAQFLRPLSLQLAVSYRSVSLPAPTELLWAVPAGQIHRLQTTSVFFLSGSALISSPLLKENYARHRIHVDSLKKKLKHLKHTHLYVLMRYLLIIFLRIPCM